MIVFVSSTYLDLVEHREAVDGVLNRMKAQYSGMEYFGSRADNAVDACLGEIAECDIFVGIYAWRYGWQPPPGTTSITEQEFDCAQKNGKKCLCYVVDQDYPWKRAFMDHGDSESRLTSFKAKVDKLVRSQFTTPDNLASQVSADLGREIARAAATSAIDAFFARLARKAANSKAHNDSPSGVIRIQDLIEAYGSTAGERRAAAAAFQSGAFNDLRDSELTRFVARKEAFGSIVYDRERMDYIPFDRDATDIFDLGRKIPFEKVAELLESRVNRKSFETFVQLCQSIELLDAGGKFTGTFIEKADPAARCLSAPLTVHFSCTKACNFSCSHCYSSSGRPYAGELTTAEVKRFVDELADIGCFDLSLGGGEPLLRADLPEIIRHANVRGLRVRISTNAAAATPEVVETLKGLKIRNFKISMEGASAEVCDAVRGEPGAFRDAVQGIQNLKELKVPLFLHRVFMKTNAFELPALVHLAESLGVHMLWLNTVMPVGRAAENPGLWLDREETNRLWDEALALQETTKLPIRIPGCVPPRDSKKKALFFDGLGCECGTAVCHVDARGNVSPTGFLKDTMSAGNLRQQTLKQIWDAGTSFVQFRNFTGNSQCAHCSYFVNCRGGCRARALFMDGDINLPDGNCAVAHGGSVREEAAKN